MIKEVLQQLEPLDAQIDALCSSADDAEMTDTTTHAAELAESFWPAAPTARTLPK